MATSTTTTLANEYQKYFSKELLDSAKQLTVMDQFADKRPLPTGKGAKVISFFRRSLSAVSTSTGLVANVQTLSEGTPISTFADATLDRIDVTLIQYGEACKVTDILTMTELFDALKQNKELLAEDCALNADSITRNALIAASNAGVTLNTASGTSTETMAKLYSGATAFSGFNNANTGPYKAQATDFLRAVTALKINRAPQFGGYYVAVIPPQVSYDLQNDPDWIDASNYGDPARRFKGELKTMHGCRFVEHTNPFIADGASTEHAFSNAGTATYKVYSSFILGRGAYGVSELSGQSPYSPRVYINDKADKSDPLNQFITAGWKAFYAAAGLNANYGIRLESKSEYNG